ncbi:hypothetical protein B0187_04720 [Haemophilus paracuniculus]|uniref:Lipoprotein HlpB n=1 Tax=Haemophilus paracuniculus TaxID=734 RepID=A0A1T0ATK2_9PAST|nr:hypothetical protein [Haemophilus paracuniculus]OOR99620.1 hypothetical protein B0187_04720 [Haemophilus paracuniculus]
MKKLATLGAVALLALSVTACNKADPKAEFTQFQTWTQSLETTRNAAQAEFQQQFNAAIESKNAEAAKAAVKNFADKLEQSIKGLDKLNFKSEEVKGLADKAKEALKYGTESMIAQVDVAVAQNPEEKAEAEKKVQEKSQKLAEFIQAAAKAEMDVKAKLGIK